MPPAREHWEATDQPYFRVQDRLGLGATVGGMGSWDFSSNNTPEAEEERGSEMGPGATVRALGVGPGAASQPWV